MNSMVRKVGITLTFFVTIQFISIPPCFSWGFFAHKKINELAVFTLPPPLLGFYKSNISSFIENSIGPDKRRYRLPSEGPRHYLDLDSFFTNGLAHIPISIDSVYKYHDVEFLNQHGLLPWNIFDYTLRLEKAFHYNNWDRVLFLSSELGHYISDASVPLHTTSNYNGQYSDQYGIHALWESRIPERSFDDWILITGKAKYLTDKEDRIIQLIMKSNSKVDSVLSLEDSLSKEFKGRKYSTKSNRRTERTYSRSFILAYDQALNGMVEKRMKEAIKLLGSVIYTCWVNAGQPLPPSDSISQEEPQDNSSAEQISITRTHE